MKTVRINDFNDRDGKWAKAVQVNHVMYKTNACALYENLKSRCAVGGAHQKRRPTYIGCVNMFSDFQSFAEWCNSEYGYCHTDENGYLWQIDKDIISIDNAVYSPETCMFIPRRINSLVTEFSAPRSALPTGVDWDSREEKYRARCRDTKWNQVTLGHYLDAESAHLAWRKFKVAVIRELCTNDLDVLKHKKLLSALTERANYIEQSCEAKP